MALKLHLVLLCAVFIPTIIAGPIINLLKKEIEEKNKETAKVNLESDQLQKDIANIVKEYEEEIDKLEIVKANNSAEAKAGLENVKNLQKNISNVEDEITLVQNEIERYNPLHIKEVLVLKWTGQYIANLKLRQSEGEDKKCHEIENDPSISNSGILLKTQAADEPDDPDKIEKLSVILQIAQIELDKATARRDKLAGELKRTTAFWQKVLDDLGKTILELINDISKLDYQVNVLQDQQKSAQKRLTEARTELEKRVNENKGDKSEIDKVKNILKEFAKDRACYDKLEKKVFK